MTHNNGNRNRQLLLICIMACIMGTLFLHNNIYENNVTKKSQDVLRLHILANSDADYDQELKHKVKNVVASKVAKDMSAVGIASKNEAMNYMADNSDRYTKLAQKVITEEGYNYSVTATIGKHWFPIKMYGDALYPAGEYDAYRMLIGSAKGKNWWCVLFPSLCMVDEACHVEEESMDKDKIQETEEAETGDKADEVRFGFRIVEWFKDMW